MTYHVEIERRPNAFGVDDRIWKLGDGHGSFVEIAPALGFNCYRWVHARAGSPPLEILWSDPNFFTDYRPTRSGLPILFPFPNRIRDGRFTWNGKIFELPKNDPTGKSAIHGFVCRKPWRVIDQGADDSAVWLTGDFQGSLDAPETLALWPADYRLQVTYRFGGDVIEGSSRLRVEAKVLNAAGVPLPFGLGYHPYFRLDGFGAEDAHVRVPANEFWPLQDNLPSDTPRAVDQARDLRRPLPVRGRQLDDVLTRLMLEPAANSLVLLGEMYGPCGTRRLSLLGSPAFREVVVFIPPHRQAVCLEPYTCTTDAVNLQLQNVDAGWLVLPGGSTWQGVLDITVGSSIAKSHGTSSD